MSALSTQDYLGEFQTKGQAVFEILQQIGRIQEKSEIYLRGSLAYYGILGFYGRCCNDIDLAAFDPAEVAQQLGVFIDVVGEDCIGAHYKYIHLGVSDSLSVEILRYPSIINIVTIPFSFRMKNINWHIQSNSAVKPFCDIKCIPMELIVTEKLFSIAYALRDSPIDEYSIYKNLYDLSYIVCNGSVYRWFPTQSILYRCLESYLNIERNRENRFISVREMLVTLRKITDIAIRPSVFLEYCQTSCVKEFNLKDERCVVRSLLAFLDKFNAPASI